MANIVTKAFDATKKIVRAVFRGSPNLITTADLNRQFEALKYQVDQLDDKTGVLSDFVPTANLKSGTLEVNGTYTFMQTKGGAFSPELQKLTVNLTASAPTAYLCLVADSETVTYESDFSHEISGAKFEDGKSYPAADHIVYKNERLVLVHGLSSVENLIAIIGVFSYKDGGDFIYTSNCIGKDKSLTMDASKSIQYLQEKDISAYPYKKGDTYDEAFSKLLGFLGDGKFLQGSWGVFQEFPQYWESDMEGGLPCTVLKFGPFVMVNLKAQSTSAVNSLVGNVDGGIYVLLPKKFVLNHSQESGVIIGMMSGYADYSFEDTDSVKHEERMCSFLVTAKSCKKYDNLDRVVMELNVNKNDMAIQVVTEGYTYTVTGGNLDLTLLISR